MFFRLIFFGILLFLIATNLSGQQKDSTISWIATGPAKATYSPDDIEYTLSLTGTHSEVTFWQNRSVFTNYIDSFHLINLDLSGEGTDSSGNLHSPKYTNLSLFYSLGYDLYLANFIHFQPYASYGISNVTYSKHYKENNGSLEIYEKKSGVADWLIYGFNFLFEFSGKIWIGYGKNYFYESQKINYEYSNSTIKLEESDTLMIIWSWEQVKIKTINPKETFWGF